MAEQSTHSFNAVVTHVVDIDRFWVQPILNSDDKKKLDAIEAKLGINPMRAPRPINVDDYISVNLYDRVWKRARLKQHIPPVLAYIQLIDYGNEEKVPESSVYGLNHDVGTDALPEQAMLCALAGAKPLSNSYRNDVISYFRNMMVNSKVEVKAYSITSKGVLLVDIVHNDIPSTVRNYMFAHIPKMAVASQFETAAYTKDPGVIEPMSDETNPVIVSSIKDLSDFYVQLKGTEKRISSMMTAMKSMYSANKHTPARVINIGMMCTVQLNSEWYRAEIKHVLSTGSILVQLKDFGNYQQVTAKQIYSLETVSTLCQAPFYAIRCGLNGIVPAAPTPTGTFHKTFIAWFENYVSDKDSYLVARFVVKIDDKYMIELYDEPLSGEQKCSTIDLLLKDNYAKRITLPPPSLHQGPPIQEQLNPIVCPRLEIEQAKLIRLQAERNLLQVERRVCAISQVPSNQASAEPPLFWRSNGMAIPLCILDNPSSSLELLGKGSFGTVYLYKDTAHQVAIKQIRIPTKLVPKEAKDVSQEVELHKTLAHPNIIQYFGSHQAENHVCIMMEYAEKRSLKECLLKSGRLKDKIIISYAKQILEGLDYLHTRIKPIIHRDLRSQNVLICSNTTRIKIADFGISKQLNTLASTSGFDTAVGNAFWQAPEMIERNKSKAKLGRKVDIWSTGITILEMVYVTPPFFKLTDFQYMYSLCQDKQLPEIPEFVDKKIRDLLGHCLVYSEKERKTAKDILKLIYGYKF